MLVFKTMCFRLADACVFALLLSSQPIFFRNNGFVNTIVKHVIVCFNSTILIARSRNFFAAPAIVSQFSAINGVIDNANQERRGKGFLFAVVATGFEITMCVEPVGDFF